MRETREVLITNKLGIHARPAAKLVALTSKYASRIVFEKNGEQADGKSLIDILTLVCPMGTRLRIHAEGSDAREALEAIEKMIGEKFGED